MIRTTTLILALLAGVAQADPPEVIDVRAVETSGGWRFDVTILHGDTGWDDYADGWEVLAPDGTRLGYRELFHPHVEEQPFTRSLTGVQIPEDLTSVLVRPRDNVTGWSDETVTVPLPGR